jgi:hypothetical protein
MDGAVEEFGHAPEGPVLATGVRECRRHSQIGHETRRECDPINAGPIEQGNGIIAGEDA